MVKIYQTFGLQKYFATLWLSRGQNVKIGTTVIIKAKKKMCGSGYPTYPNFYSIS